MAFDATGKVTLDHIYTQPDPRAYFTTLRGLEYNIPQLAKPYFAELIEKQARVVDIGCSYGINAALLNHGATMEDLYERYADPDVAAWSTSALAARDRQRRVKQGNAWIVGLDSSRPALDYAVQAGFLDDAVCADLENKDLTEEQREQLAGTDLVISTGCIGYVGASTISKVAEISQPLMAHFVLRMVPFEPVEDSLRELGYDTVKVDRYFRQRRFVSAEEQDQVLDTLRAAGVDPRGLEDTGWLYAQLHLCRPTASARTIVDLTSAIGQG
ncbi:class I SAM-dependent methyltransferase [Allokutzneria sp. A3M-2-11 16]|uniref:class I SAM-dependent methyltransferase n=1 Tax=Allokutzneria sp. A3M-2-11 16 TaxID=2962043 RepID=UPI0020B7733A|nr:class I SAM-dependent methyltransferase [Allokutzneria sp. A3M-2-11 16]MCP3802652.1 class I SAM-dependent methyltransferase [Allokutzneria sp. A3M-2-11 16]